MPCTVCRRPESNGHILPISPPPSEYGTVAWRDWLSDSPKGYICGACAIEASARAMAAAPTPDAASTIARLRAELDAMPPPGCVPALPEDPPCPHQTCALWGDCGNKPVPVPAKVWLFVNDYEGIIDVSAFATEALAAAALLKAMSAPEGATTADWYAARDSAEGDGADVPDWFSHKSMYSRTELCEVKEA